MTSSKKPFACKTLIFLHIFLGVGAVFGGGAFIIDPSGALINMPISLLEPSPFTNFFIPGIILFFVLGIMPLIIAYALSTKIHLNLAASLSMYKFMHWSWGFSLYIGFALIIWISIQVYLIQTVAFVHLIYLFLGLFIIGVTLLPSVQNYLKLNGN